MSDKHKFKRSYVRFVKYAIGLVEIPTEFLEVIHEDWIDIMTQLLEKNIQKFG